jgi:hypothetical protein
MKTYGDKHYFSRSQTRSMSIDHPIGDPFGGPAYGERNDPVTAGVVVGGGVLGGVLQGESAKKAAETQAQAQLEAARIGAESARFTPIGVTTGFGSSQFGYDSTGRLNSAGYTLTPEMQAQQQRLMAMSRQGLGQYEQAFGQSQQLGQAGAGMMNLGQQYLATSPQEQAQKFMTEQQGLLAPSRERSLAELRNQMQQTGRAGLAVGATTDGMLASNPEMAAYYNAQMQQDRELAAQATQGGQQYAQFGAGMMGSGANAYNQMYGMQGAAMSPYTTALGGAQAIEQLGQGSMDIGTALGARQQTAGAQQGQMLQQGMNAAAQSQYAANTYNPLATALQGVGQAGMMYAGVPAMAGRGGNMTAGAKTYGGGTYTGFGNEQMYPGGMAY